MLKNPQVTDEEYAIAGQRFSVLMDEFEHLPYPDVRDKIFELLQAVDVIHRAGLERLAGALVAAGQGELLAKATEDEIVGTLLALYELAPEDDLGQVETALEAIRPYIHSHGGEVEVLGVEEGVVHVRLAGACHGCAGSMMTLRRGIEAALRDGFPGFKEMQVHESVAARSIGGRATGGASGPDVFIPLIPANGTAASPALHASPRPAAAPQRPIFLDAIPVNEVPSGSRVAVDVEHVRVLIANVAGEIYAVRNNCPGSVAPLDLGSFTSPVIVCPWHNEPFDVRTGLRVDGIKEPRLQPLPIAIEDGMIRVAVNIVPEAG